MCGEFVVQFRDFWLFFVFEEVWVWSSLWHAIHACMFPVYGFDIDGSKFRSFEQGRLPSEVGIMHICYPYTDLEEFVRVTVDYGRRFKPKLMIIDSTVPLAQL